MGDIGTGPLAEDPSFSGLLLGAGAVFTDNGQPAVVFDEGLSNFADALDALEAKLRAEVLLRS